MTILDDILLKDFKKSAFCMIPWCPVVEKRAAEKERKGDFIVPLTLDQNPSSGNKPRIGNARVESRYHKKDKY